MRDKMASQNTNTELVIIGGSAGSLQVILDMLRRLRPKPGFPMILVLHRKAQTPGVLPLLLEQLSPMKVAELEDKTDLLPDVLYIAPADYHLLFEDKTLVSLDGSEKVHYSRPSIDVCFQSAAEAFGKGLVGVLLSGANADGVEGLKDIRRSGGTAWVQNPLTAEVDYMPRLAIDNGAYDKIFNPTELAELINSL